VKSVEQSERESCRVIMFGHSRSHILLVADEASHGFCLPSVQIPRWQRPAENLTTTVKSEWGCAGICLFTPTVTFPSLCSNEPRYEAMECLPSAEMQSDRAVWTPIGGLKRERFHDEADFSALQQTLAEVDCYSGDPATPFASSGWFAELQTWVAEICRPLGLQLTGSFCQLNASPSFSLICFETNESDVWFKGVGEPNLREFRITLELTRLFPKHLPEFVDKRPEWNGWLSLSAGRTNLSETQEVSSWESAVTSLARLQIESIGKSTPILSSGAHDLRAGKLSASVRPFLDVMEHLMQEATKAAPPILTRHDLELLGLRIEDSLTLLEQLRIPDALGHLDLNPGNIILSANGCVFVDWAEAYVGPPFLSFQYLLEHFRRAVTADNALESRLSAAYSQVFVELFPSDVIAEALGLAPLLAVFAYATGSGVWRDQEKLRDPKIAGHFRSLARRMNREAIQLMDRRSPCLS
jgi:hypothetical protein